jgi:hypothetical protein
MGIRRLALVFLSVVALAAAAALFIDNRGDSIVGKWQGSDGAIEEYFPDGSMISTTGAYATWKQLDDGRIIIRIPPPPDAKDFGLNDVFTIDVLNDTMTLESPLTTRKCVYTRTK